MRTWGSNSYGSGIYLSLFFMLLPLWRIGHPWNALFYFSFLILRQSVGPLWRGISPSQGRYFWYITPRIPFKLNRRCGGTCRRHLHAGRISKQETNMKHSNPFAEIWSQYLKQEGTWRHLVTSHWLSQRIERTSRRQRHLVLESLLPVSCWFRARLILWPWRWRRHVLLKRLLVFNGIQSVISQKIEILRYYTD
jgi:hypothetical protein